MNLEMYYNQLKKRLNNNPFVVLSISLVLLIILSYTIFLALPVNTNEIEPKMDPVEDFAEAVARIEKIKADESQFATENCESTLYSHGKKVEKVLVIFHGYTACPEQYREFAQAHYELGYNVLLLRMPEHGKERLGKSLRFLESSDLVNSINDSIDIANGLGESIEVNGISGGAVMAGWAFQFREDVDQATLIAPIYSFKILPDFLLKPAVKTAALLPSDIFIWWDARNGADSPNIAQESYPHFSLKSLRAYMSLYYNMLQEDTPIKGTKDRKIILISNEVDTSIKPKVTREIFNQINNRNDFNSETYIFSGELDLPHNLIGPDHPKQNIKLTIPKIIEITTD